MSDFNWGLLNQALSQPQTQPGNDPVAPTPPQIAPPLPIRATEGPGSLEPIAPVVPGPVPAGRSDGPGGLAVDPASAGPGSPLAPVPPAVTPPVEVATEGPGSNPATAPGAPPPSPTGDTGLLGAKNFMSSDQIAGLLNRVAASRGGKAA